LIVKDFSCNHDANSYNDLTFLKILGGNMKKQDQFDRTEVLKSFVSKSWNATTGLTNFAETEARKLVNQLVSLRKLDETQGEQLINELLGKANVASVKLEKTIEESVQASLETLGNCTTKEITCLQNKISELEVSIEKLVKTKNVSNI
jgi:polyhydroxyalkanoate synthesis regulator phasin